ncbi:MAG TPA: O-methyltransferase [Micrococcaceae bacterium]|jgi:predicted O-methyltransferase YrrM|nr:O-methyltransferase [Micrococcaceae bacterium]
MADHPTENGWLDVESFLSRTLVKGDDALDQAVAAGREAGLPPIEVAPTAGKLLMLLARMSGARRVLEIGTLAGFSTIWLARGIPDDGRLVSCEYSPEHAAVARRNVDRAGIGPKVDIRVGPALETLPKLADQEAFDFVFIDADKGNNINYLEWALRLTRPGSVIVLDNVIWDGTILDPEAESDAAAIRASLEFIGANPSLEATAIQTVGSKGWDGFAVALVR